MTTMTQMKSTNTKQGRHSQQGGKSLFFLFASAAALVSLIIAALYASKGGQSGARSSTQKSATRIAMDGDNDVTGSGEAAVDAGISEGSVILLSRSPDPSVDLPYLHCGPRYAADGGSSGPELVLLHGAAFTKEDWRTSGILAQLCERSGGTLSATALDLSVKSDGLRLADAFDALRDENVLSGNPASFVSPSASGKAMVHLGEMSSGSGGEDGSSGLLKRIVKSWIPVACFAVLGAVESSIRAYPDAGVPILAVHGTEDKRGKDVTERLVKVAGATGLELKGRHPCYLDSPDEFVSHVLEFIDVKDVTK